ncbi:MAG: hypothetical protein ABIP81_07670 [Terriglobales bacterium]
MIFPSTQAAKEYLISRITDQAIYEQAPLSDAETKMLYYSGDGKTVADEVADQFEADSPEYEDKVAGLLRRRYEREQAKGDFGEAKNFLEAAQLLATEDHYLTFVIEQASLDRVGVGALQSNSRVLVQALWVLGPMVVLGLVIIYWDRW